MTGRDSDRPPAGEWLTVEDPVQAKLLSDLETARYFEPFIARERSASAAAEEVGCRVDTMLYRVRQFLAAGLLEITRVQPRAGRPIKHYRSVADAFFVPFAATPFASLEELVATQMQPFNERVVRSVARLLRESGRDGRRFFRKPNGDIWNDAASDEHNPFTVDDEDVPAAYDFSIALELEPAEARQLQLELHRLFERYADREHTGGRTYLWHSLLLPAAD